MIPEIVVCAALCWIVIGIVWLGFFLSDVLLPRTYTPPKPCPSPTLAERHADAETPTEDRTRIIELLEEIRDEVKKPGHPAGKGPL